MTNTQIELLYADALKRWHKLNNLSTEKIIGKDYDELQAAWEKTLNKFLPFSLIDGAYMILGPESVELIFKLNACNCTIEYYTDDDECVYCSYISDNDKKKIFMTTPLVDDVTAIKEFFRNGIYNNVYC